VDIARVENIETFGDPKRILPALIASEQAMSIWREHAPAEPLAIIGWKICASVTLKRSGLKFGSFPTFTICYI
jgi:hypothetical protein